MPEGTHLISDKGYIDSVRFIGLTTLDAVNELIDNSFDAGAKAIHVCAFVDKVAGGISLVVADDGRGVKPENIDGILAFGGRIPQKGNITTGRFGWGLSSAACCQTRRAEFYSNVGDGWYGSYIDLDELKKLEQPIIPRAFKRRPPQHLPLRLDDKSTGTVVYFSNCDKLDYKSIDALERYFISNLGETHRYYLADKHKIIVNGKDVRIVDPLMLMKGCVFSELFGNANEFEVIQPISIKDVIDEATGKPAEIRIRIALMDLERIRKQKDWRAEVRNKGFNIDNQGFYIVRHNRQIGRALTLSVFQRHNDLNYFRGEISFPPALDNYFGVQTNKSRFALDAELREIIRKLISPPLSQIRKISKEFQTRAQAEESPEGVRPAEEIAAKAERALKKNTYQPTPKQIKDEKETDEAEKSERIKSVEENKQLSPAEKKERIRKIENEFQFKLPYKRVLATSEYGPFYYPRPRGNSTEVVINIQHPFYKKIYERAVANKLDVYLDLLLFTLVKAELMFYDRDEIRKFYESQRTEWSTILKTYLDETEDVDEE